MRILTGYRLTCILSHGGVVVPEQGTYCVHRGRDTRCQRVGWVSPHIVLRLNNLGWLRKQADFPDRLVASPALPAPTAEARLPTPRIVLKGIASKRLRDYASQVLGQDMDAATRIRLNASVGRFRDDFRRAAQPTSARLQLQTAKPADHMTRMEARIGTSAMQCLESLLIDGCSRSALAVHLSCREEDTEDVTICALSALVSAYDLSPAVDNPAWASLRIRSSIEAKPFER